MRNSIKRYIINKVVALLVVLGFSSTVLAQEKIVNPDIS